MNKQTTMALKITTMGFLALSMGMILFPIQRTPTINQVAFVRNIDQLTQTQTHGAASQWDYLFQNNEKKIYEGQLSSDTTLTDKSGTPTPKAGDRTSIVSQGTTTSSGGIYQGSMETTTTVTLQPQSATQSSLLNAMQQSFMQAIGQNTDSSTYQGSFGNNITTTGTGISKDCSTPRGQTVANNDFVLAYEQRKDVSTMCNIERRICENGVLGGSYTQNSCKEDVSYTYTRKQVISYNQPVVNPLVQPGEPSNAGADFSVNGQVNDNKQPTNMRGSTNTAGTTTDTAVSQTTTNKKSCTTPRGTTVKHGQFVKAYKSSIGLLDVPCETQLRLCVNGTLKGTLLNKTCTFKNMTYNDYIAGNKDFTAPTPQDILGTLTSEFDSGANTKNYGIWDRIKGIFK